ncbi:MAG: glutamate 5-kinase [Pseudomonadota bacterium]
MADQSPSIRAALRSAKRLVVKIGSALLVDRETGLRTAWLEALCRDLAALKADGTDVLIVSSGAIAMGRGLLGLPSGALKLEESQAAAAMGQIALARAWSEALGTHDIKAGQVLLTLADTEERRRYLNARATVETLLTHGAVPVINENDTVATSEIRYGDNDRLAARVATMTGADCLVLLSDIDGLYTAPPSSNPDAEHIPLVRRVTPAIAAMAGAAGSELSRGGMKTKVDAASIATESGCAMAIADGKKNAPLSAIANGALCTWFLPHGTPRSARKKWIAGQLAGAGKLVVDAGAARALTAGKSLLPAGVKSVAGDFARGDTVNIEGVDGTALGCGIAAYDAPDARKLAGHHSNEVEALLGFAGRAEMIHRNDMVLSGGDEPGTNGRVTDGDG